MTYRVTEPVRQFVLASWVCLSLGAIRRHQHYDWIRICGLHSNSAHPYVVSRLPVPELELGSSISISPCVPE
jgi:hypothetical protein